MPYRQEDQRLRRKGQGNTLPAAWTTRDSPMDYQRKNSPATLKENTVRTGIHIHNRMVGTGKCSACRHDLWLTPDGEVYHKKGSIPRNETCSLGEVRWISARERYTQQLVDSGMSLQKAKWQAVLLSDWNDVPPEHYQADVYVPEWAYFDKELLA